ncbi:hypothetical protein HELRODRAFT_185380 [Helobdella robusta]|uniref:Nuclear pore complex protein Nup85 n=1 Tax=Helobdella robusta TaxID=6412 RepID=T1FMQ8_HELRO|nr:hypothetical protein HELRODRAFT_185380 [Helobdella robusta]ESO08853.1 hypothetical protein HELRODRAFT_185380 [Helobdella robusta]
MQQEEMRVVLCESRLIFLNVQSEFGTGRHEDMAEKMRSNKLLAYSRQYRSTIKACTIHLQSLLRFSKDDNHNRIMIGQLELMEMTELLWSLAEIIFIDQLGHQSGRYIVSQLMDWFQMKFYDGDNKVNRVIKSELYDKHHLYWDALYSLVCLARIEEARHLLSLHSSSHTEPFRTMDLLLSKMPIYKHGQYSQQEFSLKWRQWHLVCEEQDEDGTFSVDDKLSDLCKLLAGQDQMFTKLRDSLGTWYCMLICRLFYQSPLCEATDLKMHVQFCIDQYGGNLGLTDWDNIILSIIMMDIREALCIASTTFPNWWFVCHLTDLLQHSGHIDDKPAGFGSNLREFFILEYASSLVSCPSLRDTAIGYYSSCPAYGKAHIGDLVLRDSLESTLKVEKLLHTCNKYQLESDANIICRSFSLKWLQKKQYANALIWAVRSKDTNFTASIVKKLLAIDAITMGNILERWEVIADIGGTVHFNIQLTILTKLVEYKRLLDDGNLGGAINILIVLLKEAVIHHEFFQLLLGETMSLLEKDDIQLTSDELFKLNEYVQEYRDALRFRRIKADVKLLGRMNDSFEKVHQRLTNQIAACYLR